MFKLRAELKQEAKYLLKGNWGKAITFVLVFVVVQLLIGGISSTGIGVLLPFLVGGPLALGTSIYYLNFYRGERADVEMLFSGFNNFVSALVLFVLHNLFVFLWSLLFVIPGMVAGLSYSQSFFILADHPGISAREALSLSKDMMRGHKLRYFVLELSFIGWSILCMFTLGIGYLWLIPYIQVTKAAFYQDLRDNYYSYVPPMEAPVEPPVFEKDPRSN